MYNLSVIALAFQPSQLRTNIHKSSATCQYLSIKTLRTRASTASTVDRLAEKVEKIVQRPREPTGIYTGKSLVNMPPKRFKRKAAAVVDCKSTVADEFCKSEDYMASDFVQVQKGGKREREAEVAPPVKKLTVLMAETREKGLQKELGSDNLGFKMLSKMGFQPGVGLGPKESGRTEPIDVRLPDGRGGLGRAEEARRREDDALASYKAVEVSRSNCWQEHQQERFRQRRLTAVASKAALAVRELDERAGLPRSELWPVEDDEPNVSLGIEDEREEEITPLPETQLVIAPDVSEYMRNIEGVPSNATTHGSNSLSTATELELQLLKCVDYLQVKHGWSLLHGCSHNDRTSRCLSSSEIPTTAKEEVSRLLEE